jgi:hypothetical protein
MKYIKKFEDLQFLPQVGDYVLVKIDVSKSFMKKKEKLMDFVNNTIGQIISVQPDSTDMWGNIKEGDVKVKYIDVPENIEDWFEMIPNKKYYIGLRNFTKDQVVAFGKTEEEVKQKVQSNKFNI